MNDQLMQSISAVMSAFTISSCIYLKVPQINSIKERRSADGVRIEAISMELVGMTITTLYNFANDYSFLTYLEYPIILTQLYVLFYYVLKYKRMLHLPVVRFTIFMYVITVVSFVWGLLPKIILAYMVPLSTPLSGVSKVTYIYGMIYSSNADAVSLATWLISVLTNLSRIFTVYFDSGDFKLILNFAVSSVLSLGVLVTAIYYQHFIPPPRPAGWPRRKPSYRRYSETSHEYRN